MCLTITNSMNRIEYETIGHTPLIRLDNITQSEGFQCQVFAKCEFMNPTGSTVDRIVCGQLDDSFVSQLFSTGNSQYINIHYTLYLPVY